MCLELESLESAAVTQIQLNFREDLAGFANTLRQIEMIYGKLNQLVEKETEIAK